MATSQPSDVLQSAARHVAELGTTDAAAAFISDVDLAGLGGEDEVDTSRCDSDGSDSL
jgi:DNA helicase HerA-like ATPase